jgi:hypothetical protein
MRRVLGILAVALVAGLVPATAGADTDVLELTGELVVSTSRSGSVEVLVPDGATVSSGSMAELSGEGRFVGVLLERFRDEDAFRLHAVRHPEGYTSRGIRVAEEDAGEPVSPLATSGPRSCSSACRVAPGRYTLMVVADGAPATVRLQVDGLDGSTALAEEDLDHLSTLVLDPGPHEVDAEWDPAPPDVSRWGQGPMAGSDLDREPAITFAQNRTVVESELAGHLTFTFCPTVDGRCAGSMNQHIYAANAVEGREGLVSFGRSELSAGRQGAAWTYGYDRAGHLRFTGHQITLFIWPDTGPHMGVRGVATPATVSSPSDTLRIEFSNHGTVPVLYGTPYRYERLVGSMPVLYVPPSGGPESGVWVPVDLACAVCAWQDIGYVLKPGETALHESPVTGLPPGQYRMIKEFVDHSEEALAQPYEERERLVVVTLFDVW